MAKYGRLISHGISLEPHERMTVEFFLHCGKNIELNLPSLTPGMRNPDFWMDGLVWEVKCPFVNKQDRIGVLFRHATRQSVNVIFDLRNLTGSDNQAVKYLQKIFKISRRVRHLMIICRNGDLLKFDKS